jgi:acetolactate synthase-1/2/3 large subunit
MYGSVAKWVAQVDRVERIPEYIAQAFRRALAGRPGPVVLALPEDVLRAQADAVDAPRVDAIPVAPAPAALEAAASLLRAAQAPLCIVGGSRWDDDATAALRRFADATGIPVACAFRRQDLLDNRHPSYAGDVGIAINPRLAARVRDADVLLVIGERLGEMTTSGYTLLQAPAPHQRLIHVHPGIEELGRVYQPAVAIAATPREFLDALHLQALGAPEWREQATAAHRDYEAWRAMRASPGAVDPAALVRVLDEALPDDAIVTNGAGNYTVWLHRGYRYRVPGSQLAPYSGSMGYGVPAAIAAKLLHPERVVVSWNGDGCFLMNGQELATAVQYGLDVLFVVLDNGMYGTIRMHQERNYPGRVSGTALVNPDFAALARAFGGWAATIEKTADFAPALDEALNRKGVRLLHCKTDVEQITNATTISKLREKAKS